MGSGSHAQTETPNPVVFSTCPKGIRIHRRNAFLHQPRLRHPEKRQDAKEGQGQLDRPIATVDRKGQRGGKRRHHAVEDIQDARGHHQNPQDEEMHFQCAIADGVGRHFEEHVFAFQEDDQGAD